jgi:hypothetical protein
MLGGPKAWADFRTSNVKWEDDIKVDLEENVKVHLKVSIKCDVKIQTGFIFYWFQEDGEFLHQLSDY